MACGRGKSDRGASGRGGSATGADVWGHQVSDLPVQAGSSPHTHTHQHHQQHQHQHHTYQHSFRFFSNTPPPPPPPPPPGSGMNYYDHHHHHPCDRQAAAAGLDPRTLAGAVDVGGVKGRQTRGGVRLQLLLRGEQHRCAEANIGEGGGCARSGACYSRCTAGSTIALLVIARCFRCLRIPMPSPNFTTSPSQPCN